MQSDKGGRVGHMLNDAVEVGGLSLVIAVRGMASAVLNLACSLVLNLRHLMNVRPNTIQKAAMQTMLWMGWL